MDINSLLYSFGLSGLFSSRVFLPAFMTSLFFRYGDSLPYVKNIDFLSDMAARVNEHPSWFTSTATITILGVLALVEMVAEKSPEMREVIDEFSVYAKTGLSGLTTMGVLSTSDVQFVEGMVSQAGFFDIIPALGSAGLTYFGAITRNGVMGVLNESDPDDSTKVRSFISWIEDFWTSFGVIYLMGALFIAPLAIGGFFGILHLLRKRHEGKLEEAKTPCTKCGERIHSFATGCHHCDTPVVSPNILGFLGGIKEEKAGSIEEQKLRLMRLKRSPLSGERFEGKGVKLKCEEDGITAFSDPELTKAYIGSVAEKLPKTLLLCVALGFLPVIGLIIGVIYYRLRLVAPFRRYLTFGQSFLTKWVIRFMLLLLALLQVSGGGFIAVPLMALLNFWFYRSAFRSALKKADLAVE